MWGGGGWIGKRDSTEIKRNDGSVHLQAAYSFKCKQPGGAMNQYELSRKKEIKRQKFRNHAKYQQIANIFCNS